MDSRVKKMTFTLTADATRWDGKSFSKDYLNPKKNIYATSVLTLFRLQTVLGREPDLVWVDHKKEDPELDAIQKNALQFPLIPFAGERTGAVRVCKVANPYTEIRSVVSEIRSKVMASQGAIRYRDFAVVSPSLSENLTSIEQTFADFDLPVFLDVTRPFTQNPYTKALMKAVFKVDFRPGEKIEPIEGEIPSPLDLPPGCPFASRCEHCSENCLKNKPALKEIEQGHWVACHLF